jgi:hypothetical protein
LSCRYIVPGIGDAGERLFNFYEPMDEDGESVVSKRSKAT